MLSRLSVENYALIDRLEIELASGLNIITGETGAGKSILLGALGLILGGRADASAIKDTTRNCVIEGEFDLARHELQALFEALDLDYDDHTLIRRVITPAGKSRAYVNDLPVSLNVLRELGLNLIDVHSQHQSLLVGEAQFQLDLVDRVAGHATLLEEYQKAYADWHGAQEELSQLKATAAAMERDREYITFQYNELHEAKLRSGELSELEIEQQALTHASEIQETLLWSSDRMEGAEHSLLSDLKEMEVALGRIAPVYPKAEGFFTRIHSALLDLKDLSREITADGERMESDPQRLEGVSQRLDRIYTLQQKHHVSSVEELLSLEAEYGTRLSGMESNTERIEELTHAIVALEERATALAQQITADRCRVVPQICEQIEGVLAELGMEAASLEIEISAKELSPQGADRVRFMFSANHNMPLQPIERVASGGEMSRLMLSIKALMAHYRKLPTLIFDEIDTGVSGVIADRMGEILTRMAADLQILNITHLPQVACKGEDHFFVYKEDVDHRTVTRIRKLTPQQRVDEIAKMLSGSNVTEAARAQARLLLEEAHACK
ncbi:MAG: DNA repair protein RecN [Alistipes sp.]|nr:DNA repair protein RecN [Alistipes sp.]